MAILVMLVPPVPRKHRVGPLETCNWKHRVVGPPAGWFHGAWLEVVRVRNGSKLTSLGARMVNLPPVTSASDSEDPDAETHFESAHKEVQLEGAIPKPMKSRPGCPTGSHRVGE